MTIQAIGRMGKAEKKIMANLIIPVEGAAQYDHRDFFCHVHTYVCTVTRSHSMFVRDFRMIIANF
jgi:hypothetical protein